MKDKKAKKKTNKKASAPALLTRLDLTSNQGQDLDPVSIALFAIKEVLWPNQAGYAASATSLNPGLMTSNPIAGAQAPPAQPLLPPNQAGDQQAQQQAQAPSSNGPQPSPLFSMPHPASDAARWQQMVQAPFSANSPPISDNEQSGQAPAGSKQARLELRNAFQEGRWGWFHKLGQAVSRRTLPRLFQKVAYGPTDWTDRGWQLPDSFLNNPLGDGRGQPLPAYQNQMPNISLFGNYGVMPAGDPMQALKMQELALNLAQATGSVDPYRIFMLRQQLSQQKKMLQNHMVTGLRAGCFYAWPDRD